MPLVADREPYVIEHPARSSLWCFEEEANPVANVDIRDFYTSATRRILQSFVRSMYLSRRYKGFSAIARACIAARERICAVSPNKISVSNAMKFSEALSSSALLPSKTVPIPSGGIAFYFFSNRATTYVEFLNGGESLAVTYGPDKATEIIEFDSPDQDPVALQFLRENIG